MSSSNPRASGKSRVKWADTMGSAKATMAMKFFILIRVIAGIEDVVEGEEAELASAENWVRC